MEKEPTPPPAREIVYVPAYPGMGQPEPMDDEIDLWELWQVLWQARIFIGGFTLASTLLAVLITLFVLPVTYQSEAVLMPTEEQRGGGALAGLASALPISLPGGEGGKSESIVAFLNSRTLKERLLTKYELLPRLYPDLWDAGKKKWRADDPSKQPSIIKFLQRKAKLHQISQDKKSKLITLTWEDKDPTFAALMLERIVAELQYYLDHEHVSDAKRERESVEKQLAKATGELHHWEHQLPSQDLFLSTIQRELQASQAVYGELRRQFELAKIAEAKAQISFKVLDPPFIPELKFKPKRSLICALTLVASGMLAILLVFARRAVINRQQARTNENDEAPCAAKS